MRQHGRFEEHAVALAAQLDLGSSSHRFGDPALDPLGRIEPNHRPDIGVLVEHIAELQLLNPSSKGVEKRRQAKAWTKNVATLAADARVIA